MSGPFDIGGRRALITGGGGRLGQGIAGGLAAAGADVVLAGRDIDRLERAAEALGARSAGVQRLDVADEDSIASGFEEIEGRGGPVQILVNCAGVASPASFGDVSAAEFARVC